MNYGYIVLSINKYNWLSKCIRWFTNSKYSHSFVIIPSILEVPMAIEAGATGVDAVRFDNQYIYDNTQGYEIWKINAPQHLIDESIKLLLNDLELQYGYLQYPWFIWRKLNKIFGKDIKWQDNWNKDGMICSQLCVSHLKYCGFESVFNGYGNGSVAPQDLQDIFTRYPDLFEKIEVKE